MQYVTESCDHTHIHIYTHTLTHIHIHVCIYLYLRLEFADTNGAFASAHLHRSGCSGERVIILCMHGRVLIFQLIDLLIWIISDVVASMSYHHDGATVPVFVSNLRDPNAR